MGDILRTILPYTYVVGQEKLKLALELAYIAPRIGGILVSGQRGTAKSTTVRAFARMVYQHLPVMIPITATEDRVIGGWQVQELIKGKTEKLPGLIEETHNKPLYIDEVNLLDDHLIIILDLSALSLAAARTSIMLVGATVVHLERHGQQEVWIPRYYWLAGCQQEQVGSVSSHLLDRFALRLAWHTTDQLAISHQDRLNSWPMPLTRHLLLLMRRRVDRYE